MKDEALSALESQSNENEKRIQGLVNSAYRLTCFAAVALVTIVSLWAYFTHGVKITDVFAALGQTGDFVGGILNPIFSLITIAIVLITLLLQRVELRDAQAESKSNHATMQRQNITLERQRFEQTFFSWLTTYRNIVSNFSAESKTGSPVWSGYAGLDSMYQYYVLNPRMVMYAALIGKGEDPDQDVSELDPLIEHWKLLYKHGLGHLDTMFRSAYRLMRWIDEHDPAILTPLEKMHYVSVVRAHVSYIEYKYWYFNALTPQGAKTIPLIEKYAFFDNMETGDPIIDQLLLSPFNPFTPQAFSSERARNALLLKQ